MIFTKKLINRVSVRDFNKKDFPQKDIDTITKVINNSPTSMNHQQFSAIIILDKEIKKFISDNSRQDHIKNSSVFILFVADRTRIQHIMDKEGITSTKGFKYHEVIREIVDATIAATYTLTGLLAMGYGVTMVGGIYSFIDKIQEKLNLPSTAVPILGLSVGMPSKINPTKPKMNKVFINKYNVDASLQAQEEYSKSSEKYFQKINEVDFISQQLRLIDSGETSKLLDLSGKLLEKAIKKSIKHK